MDDEQRANRSMLHDLSSVGLVGVGGAVGASMRWGALELFPDRISLVIVMLNAIGSMLLGWLAGRGLLGTPVWGLAGVGFCGGLTTFSSFALDTAVRLDDGQAISASWLVAATILTAVGAAMAGHAIGRSIR